MDFFFFKDRIHGKKELNITTQAYKPKKENKEESAPINEREAELQECELLNKINIP